ncbi:hypothetical protein RHMOL_Rhmol13G0161000 [Rhododendron molle]|uniref:Uncharacterized protein n=1 Tax=Rhododendron molle TaxID=49168 RepID=A0ACC0L8R1_RHOML|nr:hypothetical protein RHMOL_Rhmol13G0161000 [Rhododendron molle]
MSFKMGCSSSKNAMNKSESSKQNLTTATTNKFSVLVVDDDLVIQRIHKVFLNRFGFETHVVGNGKEAVDLYRSGASFHLVLMDMEMPIMDGPELLDPEEELLADIFDDVVPAPEIQVQAGHLGKYGSKIEIRHPASDLEKYGCGGGGGGGRASGMGLLHLFTAQ